MDEAGFPNVEEGEINNGEGQREGWFVVCKVKLRAESKTKKGNRPGNNSRVVKV